MSEEKKLEEHKHKSVAKFATDERTAMHKAADKEIEASEDVAEKKEVVVPKAVIAPKKKGLAKGKLHVVIDVPSGSTLISDVPTDEDGKFEIEFEATLPGLWRIKVQRGYDAEYTPKIPTMEVLVGMDMKDAPDVKAGPILLSLSPPIHVKVGNDGKKVRLPVGATEKKPYFFKVGDIVKIVGSHDTEGWVGRKGLSGKYEPLKPKVVVPAPAAKPVEPVKEKL
jgi:hypothetical protein